MRACCFCMEALQAPIAVSSHDGSGKPDVTVLHCADADRGGEEVRSRVRLRRVRVPARQDRPFNENEVQTEQHEPSFVRDFHMPILADRATVRRIAENQSSPANGLDACIVPVREFGALSVRYIDAIEDVEVKSGHVPLRHCEEAGAKMPSLARMPGIETSD